MKRNRNRVCFNKMFENCNDTQRRLSVQRREKRFRITEEIAMKENEVGIKS
jgi:hypothetical protein